MRIIRGKLSGARKVCVYGPEGIGKSTFASHFPDPVFIDTEGSTKDMDVARMEAPSSWQMLMEQVKYVKAHPETCRTLVIDTADWAEMLCTEAVCARSQKSGIEDFGYGKGYVYLTEEFGRLLNLLQELVDIGIHVVINAHAKMRKFEQPDEMGAYDRWELKLQKQTAPLLKEWADMVLFANYKTIVVNVDGQGAQKGKNKAQGGKRVMYTSHHPCWDAKNRYELPEELPFDYREIASIIEPAAGQKTPAQTPPPVAENPGTEASSAPEQPAVNPPAQEQKAPEPERNVPDYIVLQQSKEENIPKALLDLMIAHRVTEWDVQNAVSAKGYFPSDTPIERYDKDFIMGVLIEAWPQVYEMIQKEQKELDEEVPFNR
ncbi:MAG: AAA family ATPase [Lachnospiraceae bacterium]|nr:AAA family ATPase [Lachnospiraceae bacterium]